MSFQVNVVPGNHTFPAEANQSVLDAALAAGIVLPYSCRNGACSSCKARVVSGDYDAGPAPAQILDADEIAQGYTLLCQAHARSDLEIEATAVHLASDIQVRKLPARVIGIERAAPDVMILTLQLPAADPLKFYAGQYVDMLLRDGQRRSYSIARAPHADGPLELHVRHMPGGVFTDHVFGVGATTMKERDIVRFEGPLGSFFLREDSDGVCADQGHRRTHRAPGHHAPRAAVLGRTASARFVSGRPGARVGNNVAGFSLRAGGVRRIIGGCLDGPQRFCTPRGDGGLARFVRLAGLRLRRAGDGRGRTP